MTDDPGFYDSALRRLDRIVLVLAGAVVIAMAVREGLQRSVIASIGPTTSETLEVFGFTADLMPSHPKMGFLVSETAAAARTILEDKRT